MVQAVRHLLRTILAVACALASLAPAETEMRSRPQLAAENLFLRKQLALYQERKVRPRRADDATRIILLGLSHFLPWRQLLVIVKPETLIGWHRKAIPTVLALEIAGARPADSLGPTAADRDDGGGESDLGRGTHCERAAGQAWHPVVAADGAAVHAVPTTARSRARKLAHVLAEPRPMRARE
jgi:hypothetical protein